MDTALLLKWLDLPPGAWPPDPRPLLGLPADGPADPAAAETNALVRMEKLRPHQLLHPELVTEGMNRLAQALLAVSAPPATPAVPDSASGFDLAPAEALPPAAEEVFDAEVVATRPPRRRRKPRAAAPVSAAAAVPPPLVQLEPLDPAAVVPPPGAAFRLTDRRLAYRELAALRRLRRVWERLGPVAGVPSEKLASAEAIYVALSAGEELRALAAQAPAVAKVLDPDGRLVVRLFRRRQVSGIVRHLVPSQRIALASDWANGRVRIEACTLALRESLRDSVPRRPIRQRSAAAIRHLRRYPEWFLLALGSILGAATLWKALRAG